MTQPLPLRTCTCVICSREFTAKRADAIYCGQVCTQRAYRRRKAAERIEEQRRAARDADHQRQTNWCRLLMDRASLSRKQAERVFVVLDEFGRDDGSPWEQQALDV